MIISKELNVYSDIIKRMGMDKRVLATHVSLFTSLFPKLDPLRLITSASGNWTSMVTSIISRLFTRRKAA